MIDHGCGYPDSGEGSPAACSAGERRAEGAELVAEIRSQEDETYEKVGFYADLEVREMLIVHPADRQVELLRSVGGRPLSSAPTPTAACAAMSSPHSSPSTDGRLRLTWDEGVAEL